MKKTIISLSVLVAMTSLGAAVSWARVEKESVEPTRHVKGNLVTGAHDDTTTDNTKDTTNDTAVNLKDRQVDVVGKGATNVSDGGTDVHVLGIAYEGPVNQTDDDDDGTVIEGPVNDGPVYNGPVDFFSVTDITEAPFQRGMDIVRGVDAWAERGPGFGPISGDGFQDAFNERIGD